MTSASITSCPDEHTVVILEPGIPSHQCGMDTLAKTSMLQLCSNHTCTLHSALHTLGLTVPQHICQLFALVELTPKQASDLQFV